MNLLSSILAYTARQIAALRAKDTSQDAVVSGINTRLTTAEGDIDSLEAQFTTVVSAVTTDTEVTNIRVGDDGVTYDTAGNAVRTQFSNLKSELRQITINEANFVNASVSGSFSAKRFTRSFGANDTTALVYLIGNNLPFAVRPAVEGSTKYKIKTKCNITDPSSKLHLFRLRIWLYDGDGKTIGGGLYSPSISNGVIQYELTTPSNAESIYIDFQAVLTSAHGSAFSMTINFDYFVLFKSGVTLDEFVFGSLVKQEDFNDLSESVSKLSPIIDENKIETKDFSFIQGDREGDSFNRSMKAVHTELIPFDFEDAIITVPQGFLVCALRWDGNKNYLRYGPTSANEYSLHKNTDEFYFSVIVYKADNSDIPINNFDSAIVKMTRFHYDSIADLYNHPIVDPNAMFYFDRINNRNGRYWLYQTEGGTKGRYLEDRIADILKASGIPLLFITDTHWRTNSNSNHSWDLCGIIADRTHCQNVVFGGDALTQHASSNEGAFQLANELSPFTMRFGRRFKYVFGNHDANLANATEEQAANVAVPYETVYDYGIAHLKESVNFEDNNYDYQSEEWYRSKLHYYFDDLHNKIRYIVLDSGTRLDLLPNGGSPSRLRYQYDWLADVLKATPIGYHILVIAHEFWEWDISDESNPTIAETNQGINVSRLLSAYENGTTVHIGATTEAGNTYNYDFSEGNKCPIIAMLSGHVHLDYLGEKNGIVNITTICDAVDHTVHAGTEMTAGTISEHAFDVLKIDKSARKVRIFRIGAGNDREFSY